MVQDIVRSVFHPVVQFFANLMAAPFAYPVSGLAFVLLVAGVLCYLIGRR